MKKSILLLACLIGMVSCSDHKSIYDSGAEEVKKKEDFKNNFPVENIDPNQNWKTFTDVSVSVAVNEDLGATYQIKLYTENPLQEESGAMLLAKGDVKSGSTFSMELEIPSNLEGLYVACVDAKGAYWVKYASVNEGKVSTYFGTPIENRSVQARGLDLEDKKQECPYTKEEIEDKLRSAIELGGNNVTEIDAVYKVTKETNRSNFSMKSKASDGLWVIITNGATLHVENGGMENKARLIVYNGTLDLKKSFSGISSGTEIIVFPEGKITGSQLSTQSGQNQVFYNAGTINLNALTFSGGGTIYNCGDINVTTWTIGAQNTHLVNMKKINITDEANMSGTIIYNLCYMYAKKLSNAMYYNIADNAYLKVGNLETKGGADIKMGNRSVLDLDNFKCLQSAIHGPSNPSEKAYVKITNADKYGTWNKPSSGNLVIDVNYSSITENWQKNQLKQNLLREGQSTESQVTTASLTFGTPTEGECSGTISVNGKEEGDKGDKMMVATYAFEDLGSIGDYDFNDVVFQVSHLAQSTEATLKLVAAGGRLPVKVKYNSDYIYWSGGVSDVHGAFGVSLTEMVNTGRGATISDYPIATIEVPSSFSFNNANFLIEVTEDNKQSVTITGPLTGEAPQRLCVPGEWKYPSESSSIIKAYPDFGTWSGDLTQMEGWHLNGNPQYIYNK